MNIVFLVVGLLLILWGANALTDGASAIAKKWGVSDLMIGLTVVAFGTSAPELTISIISSINGNAGMAIGNVVGSNIFNVLVIIGVTAMFRPIKVEKNIMTTDIPLVVLSALILLVMGNSKILDKVSYPEITRTDGILLLFFFLIFMRYTYSQARTQTETTSNSVTHEKSESTEIKMWKAWTFSLLGLAALIFGGDRFVTGASGIASSLGVSDAVIGLTIVAVGTSLPELATSITAALKGKTGIALGNVIGSNIYNIFLVLGCSATIRPLPFGNINNFDLLTLTGGCILFWIFGWFFSHRTINRIEGTILFLIYIAYITLLLLSV